MQHPKDANLFAHDVLPLFIVRREGAPTAPIAFVGSGFVIADNVLVTCHHCVRSDIPDDQVYAAIHQRKYGSYGAAFLENITSHPRGFDLVTASVPLLPKLGFELASDVAATGGDVFSYGYPYTSTQRGSDGTVTFLLNPRYLQGYVTRRFMYEQCEYGPTPAYELDMPAPGGMSGAPLVIARTRRVVGVIFGTYDVAQIEELASVDATTGDRTPEIHRIVSFALAHHTSTLNAAIDPRSGESLGAAM